MVRQCICVCSAFLSVSAQIFMRETRPQQTRFVILQKQAAFISGRAQRLFPPGSKLSAISSLRNTHRDITRRERADDVFNWMADAAEINLFGEFHFLSARVSHCARGAELNNNSNNNESCKCAPAAVGWPCVQRSQAPIEFAIFEKWSYVCGLLFTSGAPSVELIAAIASE